MIQNIFYTFTNNLYIANEYYFRSVIRQYTIKPGRNFKVSLYIHQITHTSFFNIKRKKGVKQIYFLREFAFMSKNV